MPLLHARQVNALAKLTTCVLESKYAVVTYAKCLLWLDLMDAVLMDPLDYVLDLPQVFKKTSQIILPVLRWKSLIFIVHATLITNAIISMKSVLTNSVKVLVVPMQMAIHHSSVEVIPAHKIQIVHLLVVVMGFAVVIFQKQTLQVIFHVLTTSIAKIICAYSATLMLQGTCVD